MIEEQQYEDKKVKIFYLNESQQWNQYTQATLRLQPREGGGLNLNFFLKQALDPSKLTVLPLIQIYRESTKVICIEMPMISEAEKLGDNIFAFRLDEWNRVLAVSFRDQDYCSMVLQEIELHISSINQLPCDPEQYIKYISDEIISNPTYLDLIFENQQTTEQFFTFVNSHTLNEQDQKNVFRIIKSTFMRSNKSVLQNFLKDQYYLTVLNCLSMNYQFGDRYIDYAKQYIKIQKYKNIFEFQQQQLISKYRDIIKTRFLIDYPTSMFIELHTQITLQDIIRDRTIGIMVILKEHPQFFEKYKDFATADPTAYLEVFSEVWEMFKLIIEDYSTARIKNEFYLIFRKESLLAKAFECVIKVSQENKAQMRVYQKFIESLNPFLSYKWNQSQELLLELYKNKEPHLLQALKCILALDDYNTKSIVLQFARFLVQPTQNRKNMKQSFYSYVFSQFVSCIEPYFNTTQELQIFIIFLLKCYRMDHIRTRRCIIESNLLSKLQAKSENKYGLILILKFLRGLMEMPHKEIFFYLIQHRSFLCLKDEYFYAKKFTPRGILYSLFLGFLQDCKKNINKGGAKFIYYVMSEDKGSK